MFTILYRVGLDILFHSNIPQFHTLSTMLKYLWKIKSWSINQIKQAFWILEIQCTFFMTQFRYNLMKQLHQFRTTQYSCNTISICENWLYIRRKREKGEWLKFILWIVWKRIYCFVWEFIVIARGVAGTTACCFMYKYIHISFCYALRYIVVEILPRFILNKYYRICTSSVRLPSLYNTV